MKYYFLESFNFIIVPKKYRNENEINFSELKNLIFVPKKKRNENEILVKKKTERNENRVIQFRFLAYPGQQDQSYIYF